MLKHLRLCQSGDGHFRVPYLCSSIQKSIKQLAYSLIYDAPTLCKKLLGESHVSPIASFRTKPKFDLCVKAYPLEPLN